MYLLNYYGKINIILIIYSNNMIFTLKCWKTLEQKFLPVTEKNIYSGNIEHVSTKEKSKFPQEFFPEVSIMFKNIVIRIILNPLLFFIHF